MTVTITQGEYDALVADATKWRNFRKRQTAKQKRARKQAELRGRCNTCRTRKCKEGCKSCQVCLDSKKAKYKRDMKPKTEWCLDCFAFRPEGHVHEGTAYRKQSRRYDENDSVGFAPGAPWGV